MLLPSAPQAPRISYDSASSDRKLTTAPWNAAQDQSKSITTLSAPAVHPNRDSSGSNVRTGPPSGQAREGSQFSTVTRSSTDCALYTTTHPVLPHPSPEEAEATKEILVVSDDLRALSHCHPVRFTSNTVSSISTINTTATVRAPSSMSTSSISTSATSRASHPSEPSPKDSKDPKETKSMSLKAISNAMLVVDEGHLAAELTQIEWALFEPIGSRDWLRHALVKKR